MRTRLLTSTLILALFSTTSFKAQTTSPPLALAERPGGDSVAAAVADGNGGVWLAGTVGINLATTPDALKPSTDGSGDAFIIHVGADGSVLYATYLGGTRSDVANGIARDASGNIYVVGNTGSVDFPTTTGSLQPSASGSGVNAFVVKLDPTGRHIVYSTYLGGTLGDGAYAVAVDAAGSAAVVGWTQGAGFPTTWGRCLTYTTSQNSSFYTRLSPDGSRAVFSTCLDDSTAAGVTLDGNGDAWVVGAAGAQFGPRMGFYIGTFPQNGAQGFLTKFTSTGSNPIPISMYVGGDVSDTASAVAVTSKGVYIAGNGYSHNYPGGATRPPEPHTATLAEGRQITYEGTTAWIMKVALDGTQVLGTTLINGNGDNDRALALKVDSLEVVHVTGDTTSTDFPTSADAPQRALAGSVDAWYAQAWMPNNTVANPTYLTYLGGGTIDRGYALAFDGNGGVWIGGETNSANFPSVNAKTASTKNGFIARYGQPAQAPSGGGGSDVVLYAKDASAIGGSWQLVADGSAAGSTRIWNPDAGVGKIATPAASPANYFELTFQASAGVPYHLWLRMKADNDSWQNDSVWVQFSDSVDGGGNPVWRNGTSSGTVVSLEDCSGCGEQGWGWNDNGYNSSGQTVMFASGGAHTIRIQQREDGISIDQVVLSPSTWLTAAPGANKNDSTILGGSTPPPPPPNQPPAATLTSPANGATFTAPASITIGADAIDSDGTISRVEFYANSALIGTVSGAPGASHYAFTWSNVPAGSYSLTAVAIDDAGAATPSSAVSVTVNAAPASEQCSSLTLSKTFFYSGGPASNWTITVTAPNDTCTWTASVDQAWLVLGLHEGPATISGKGSGTVRLQTTDNRSGAYRYGTFTIGGVAYKVTQEWY